MYVWYHSKATSHLLTVELYIQCASLLSSVLQLFCAHLSYSTLCLEIQHRAQSSKTLPKFMQTRYSVLPDQCTHYTRSAVIFERYISQLCFVRKLQLSLENYCSSLQWQQLTISQLPYSKNIDGKKTLGNYSISPSFCQFSQFP